MKKWKMMALICVLCGSLSGCGLSFCGIPLGKREPLTFVCGEKNVEMQADEEADGTASADTSVTSTQSDTSYSDGKVNINTAGLEELMTLKGVGESRARAIIEYREQQGAFETPEDIMNISGIKEGVFSKIKDQIAVR